MYAPLLPPGVGDARFVAAMDYVYRELRRIQETFDLPQLPERAAAPEKPRDGMIVLADGSSWEPVAGQGAGFYGYYAGAWHKLG